MTGWREVRLGDVATITAGGDAPKNAFSKTKTDKFAIPIYSNGITDKGLYGYTNKATIIKPATTISARGTIGAVFRRTEPYLPIVRLISVIGNEEIVDSDFLYYALCNQRIEGDGSVQAQLTVPMISNYYITIPSLQTQKRIARILSSLDDKIEVNNQINRNLEEQAFSFYKNLINEAKKQCELNSIAVLNPVRSLQKDSVALCIDMAQLSTSSAYPNPGIYKSYGEGMKFQNGDTLLARITPCLENGKTAYIDFLKEGEVAFGSTEYIVLSSRGEMPPQFFYCLARDKHFRDYAIKHMNGSSGRQRVSADALAKYMIPSISKEDMRLFGQNVEPLFKLMRQKADENIRLSTLRDTLLPKLMSGIIHVPFFDNINIQIYNNKGN